MAVMRVRYEKHGKHYYCRVFTAPEWHLTFANCGQLVFAEIEWESVKSIMAKAEFIESQPNRKGA